MVWDLVNGAVFSRWEGDRKFDVYIQLIKGKHFIIKAFTIASLFKKIMLLPSGIMCEDKEFSIFSIEKKFKPFKSVRAYSIVIIYQKMDDMNALLYT